MLPSELTIAQWIVQTLFLGLFVWLLWDTRKENRARQERADGREESQAELLHKQSETFATFVTQMGNLLAQSSYSQELQIKMVERFDALTQQVIRLDVDIRQMREWVGDRRAKLDTGELRATLGDERR